MATDLTWQELAAELPAGAITYDAGTSDILISAKAITGDTYTAIGNTGVAELIFKLRAGCTDAQDTVNDGAAEGERLAAFPDFSYGQPVNGQVEVTQISTFVLPLVTSTVLGPTA